MSHLLDDRWPEFLNWIRSDDVRERDRGLTALWGFLNRLVSMAPPSAYASLQSADRENVVQDVLLKCAEGALLGYQNRGRPFAAWLWVVVSREAYNVHRKRRPTEEVQEHHLRTDPEAVEVLGAGLISALRVCLDRAPAHYRRALEWVAYGLKPLDVLRLGPLPGSPTNVQLGNLFHDARKSLKKCLEGKGFGADVLLEA